MRDLIYYISRWNSTNAGYLQKNVLSSVGIFALACYATKSGVFEVYSSTRTCLFSILMCNVWSGTFNSIALFYSESEYVTDDLNKFLSVKTYVIANLIIQLFLCLVESALSIVLFELFYDYDTIGIVFSNKNFDYWMTFLLVLFSADMLGFLLGMLIKNIDLAMAIIPVVLIVNLLLSGCLFDVEGVLDSISNVTTAKWGFAALGSISDLNSFLPPDMKNSLFECTSTYILYCWGRLIMIAAVCFIGSGVLLYYRLNWTEN